MGQICLECLISARWSTVRLQSMMFSATFAREAPEKQHNPAPVPISHCHFPLRRVWERISSHFFTYADLGTLGTRQGGPDLGTSGPVGLVSASRSSASSASATPSLSFFVASSCDEDTLCVWSRVAACLCCFV